MKTGWTPRSLKYYLSSNEGGIWGEDPNGGADDTVVLRSTDITLGGGWSIEEPAIRAVEPAERERKRVKTGDLIVVKSSGSALHLGKTALVTPGVAELGACFANFVQRLRPASYAEPRYIWYLLNSDFAVSQVAVLGTTTTGLRNINGEILGAITCPGPPLAIQSRIADFLDVETARIDAIISKRRRLIELLDERVQAIISVGFGDRMARSPDGVPVSLGESPSVRLGSLAFVQSGLTLDAGREADTTWVTRPYLRVANVQDGRVDLAEIKEVTVPLALARRCELRAGDVLMTEGGDPDKLGRGAVWDGLVVGCLHQNHIFAVRPGPALLPEYLAMLTRTSYARVYFEVTASKTTGIASTSMTKIAAFRVPLPLQEVQRAIVASISVQLDDVERLRRAAVRQIERLQERRQALITAALTGELDIPGVSAA